MSLSQHEYNSHCTISTVSVYDDINIGTKRYFYSFQSDPQYETFMDFDTWFSLYKGDPQNWHYYLLGSNDAVLPFYVDDKKMCHFIKFTSRRDYYKMKKVFEKKQTSMENEANLQEQIELSTMIRKRALERSKEALERQKKAEEELRILTEQMINIGTRSMIKVPEEKETLRPRTWEEI